MLTEIESCIQQRRICVVRSANAGLIELYWEIGRVILARQASAGWGAKVIDRLAADLRVAYPDMRGFSPRNLMFMRAFAESYEDSAIVKQLVSQLPWGHVVRLLQRVKTVAGREWYARQVLRNGWSRSTLERQIQVSAFQRNGQAQNIAEIEAELGSAIR